MATYLKALALILAISAAGAACGLLIGHNWLGMPSELALLWGAWASLVGFMLEAIVEDVRRLEKSEW